MIFESIQVDYSKTSEILHLRQVLEEIGGQELAISKLLDSTIKRKEDLELQNEEKGKLSLGIQTKLHETRNLFDSYINSLAKTLFETEFKSKYENFMALQKVYGAKVLIISCLVDFIIVNIKALKTHKDLLYRNILEKLKLSFKVVIKIYSIEVNHCFSD